MVQSVLREILAKEAHNSAQHDAILLMMVTYTYNREQIFIEHVQQSPTRNTWQELLITYKNNYLTVVNKRNLTPEYICSL